MREHGRLFGLGHLAQQQQGVLVTRGQRPGREADEVGEEQGELRGLPAAAGALHRRVPDLKGAEGQLVRRPGLGVEEPVGDPCHHRGAVVARRAERVTEARIARKGPPDPT